MPEPGLSESPGENSRTQGQQHSRHPRTFFFLPFLYSTFKRFDATVAKHDPCKELKQTVARSWVESTAKAQQHLVPAAFALGCFLIAFLLFHYFILTRC